MAALPTIAERLRRIRGAHLGLAAAASAISYGLVRAKLLPEQASIVSIACPILVLVALLYVLVFDQSLRRHLRSIVHAAMIAVLSIVLISIFCVETLEDYPKTGETRRYLVGVTLSAEGAKALSQLGGSGDLLRYGGVNQIPTWYGWDYGAIVLAYVASYIVFVVAVVLVVGVIATRPLSEHDLDSKKKARSTKKSAGKSSD